MTDAFVQGEVAEAKVELADMLADILDGEVDYKDPKAGNRRRARGKAAASSSGRQTKRTKGIEETHAAGDIVLHVSSTNSSNGAMWTACHVVDLFVIVPRGFLFQQDAVVNA